jgi:hypothetical protein
VRSFALSLRTRPGRVTHYCRKDTCNVTPRLPTLLEVPVNRACRLWLRHGVWLALRSFWLHRAALDVQARNFGWESSTGRLFYVDDEVYCSPTYLALLARKRDVLT